jgi:hypothetical protein
MEHEHIQEKTGAFSHLEQVPHIHTFVPNQNETSAMWRQLFPEADGENAGVYEGKDSLNICLALGDKQVLIYTMESNEFDTLIVSRDGVHIEGATTALCTKADEIMQEHANCTGKTYHYDFATQHPKLVKWAQGTGAAIFKWDTVEHQGSQWIFSKKYYPEQNDETPVIH